MKTNILEDFTIETEKTIDEVICIFNKSTCTNISIFSRFKKEEYQKYFIGKISENKFKMKQNTHSSKTILPYIYGSIESDSNKTKIHVTITKDGFSHGFMIFWFVFVIIMCIINILVRFDFPFILTPFAMLPIGIIVEVMLKNNEKKMAEEARHKMEELFAD